ncbi:MAG: hypothetical protein MR867_05185 [Eubacterium sp.]|nr:hypothetical protein [Eubacterium sp.]MDD7210313.1 hypothetical protein [Lachnospiraceae bacterium]MDY5496867.1 hypothetical protein [Anaerobutyricum sp.]
MRKEELFEKEDPVIRELETIPEIIFKDEIVKLPSSAIPVKVLFEREQMDHYHVDALILKKIALQVLKILAGLSEKQIYPGLIGPEDIYVDMDSSRYNVFLLHPEKFQLLDFEQDFEWYPEDERIFGDKLLFDEQDQKIADNRLMYKLLTASSRGNVKIPPGKTQSDYSELFYNIMPEEWKNMFADRKPCEYDRWKVMLAQSIRTEENFEQITRKNLEEKEQEKEKKQAERLQKKKGKGAGVEQFDLFVILRTELEHTGKISRLLYLLQDEIETENRILGRCYQQAFVYGNGCVEVKEFAPRPEGFRCQFPQSIREYSAGEALIISADLVEEKIRELSREEKETEKKEICLYILTDGRIENDKIFQTGVSKLKQLREKGVRICLRSVTDNHCEAMERLFEILEDKNVI